MLTSTTASAPSTDGERREVDIGDGDVTDRMSIQTVSSPTSMTSSASNRKHGGRLRRVVGRLCYARRRATRSPSLLTAPSTALTSPETEMPTACRCSTTGSRDEFGGERCRCADDQLTGNGVGAANAVPAAPSTSDRTALVRTAAPLASENPVVRRTRRLEFLRRLFICGCRRNRKTSLAGLPKYGVQPSNEELLAQRMADINSWGVDIFTISEASNSKPLTAIVFTILQVKVMVDHPLDPVTPVATNFYCHMVPIRFYHSTQERGLPAALKISSRTLLSFLVQLESNYHTDIPYHNNLHAADVAQSSHVLLNTAALQGVFSDLELFAAIFAGAVHDVDHPGFNSQFLVNSNSELATLYNDAALLETHHLHVAFSLLQREGCDVFENFNRRQRLTVRRIVVDMVLATDMCKHDQYLSFLQTRTARSSTASQTSHRRIIDNKRQPIKGVFADRCQILQCIIHCSDLSNPAKPFELYRQWTVRITEEFFRQGDHEQLLGLQVSPVCDRRTASVARTQISFIDNLAYPLWKAWADFVYPDSEEVLETIRCNRHWQLTVGMTGESRD